MSTPSSVTTHEPSGCLEGPLIKTGAAIGANTTIIPGVCIGEGAFVAAGSIVTHDVPDHMMAIGTPARIKEIPQAMLKSGKK